MVFGSLGGLVSEGVSLLNPLTSQQPEKDRIKNLGIALIVFGSIAFAVSVTYIILKSGSLMNLDVIVYMTIASSVIVIVIGILPLCFPNASIVKRVTLAVSIFILSLVSVICNIVLIGIGIHIIVMQRDALVDHHGITVNMHRIFTIGIGSSLLVIAAIEAFLCTWIVYIATGIDEIQVVFKYIRWNLGF